ncbi:MAG: YqjK family protein [Undibacterium sp.]|jgi:hypothetical protein|uniref:YqjK family protein n=1 Tax=Undibacterium sp. TaxID=1914977 RepID=UPI00271CC548|nr:YqjK family protein [Undibacterium sp.]MDO8651430.1 YqjK family protein [Undibacterium sp.]
MSNFSEHLSLRRQTLLAKSQAERMLLTQHSKQLRQSLLLADIGFNVGCQIAGKIKQRPAIGIGLLVALLVIKPARVLSFLKNGVAAWQIWQNIAPALKRFQDGNSASNRH